MRKVLWIVVALALASPVLAQEEPALEAFRVRPVIASAAAAMGPGGPGGPERPQVAPKQVVATVLALSTAQVAQWEQLLATLEQTVKPIVAQIVAKETQLRELMKQTAPDPAAVGALVVAIRDLAKQIDAARDTYVQGFEALLTAEQKAKLEFLRKAERAQLVLPAFKLFGLLPPPEAPPAG